MDPTEETVAGKIKVRKRYDIPKTAKCHVCGDLAAEHLHYGGIACYSCRAFFRRTVNSNRPMLDCSNGDNCPINKETRKRCQSCRFDKCKAVGMKPLWVLSEDDKSKLSGLTDSIKQNPAKEITIKKEEVEDANETNYPSNSNMQGVGMSNIYNQPFLGQGQYNQPGFSQNNRFGGGEPPVSSGRSSIPESMYSGKSGSGFQGNKDDLSFPEHINKDDLFQPEHQPSQVDRADARTEPAPSLFPFQKMQVSLSAPGRDGLSFTIEAHQAQMKDVNTGAGQKRSQGSIDHPFTTNGGSDADLNSRYTEHYGPQGPHGYKDGPGYSQEDAQRYARFESNKKIKIESSLQGADHNTSNNLQYENRNVEKTHSQQTRTIFRHSGISNTVNSGLHQPSIQQGSNFHSSSSTFHSSSSSTPFQEYSNSSPVFQNSSVPTKPFQDSSSSPFPNNTDSGTQFQHSAHLWNSSSREDTNRAQVWKIETEGGISQQTVFQETLFLEQLAAIDERVRFQVPMEIEHGRAFLECALTGKKISQSTIMHAYQTCIKRIVRFANSLQDFVELPPEDMHKLLVANTVNMINIRIARWFNPKTNLESQLSLCCTGVDLYKEVSIQQDLDSMFVEAPVNQEDVFVSPWCCDSSYEDRYFALMNSIHKLPMDTTSMVLLSVMTLFDSEKTTGLQNFEMILSHEKKFALLLYRYISTKHNTQLADEYLPKYIEAVRSVREMAEILINKRLL